jgi:ComF family protein
VFTVTESTDNKSAAKANKWPCVECKQRDFVFDRVFSLGKYADELQAAVVRMKYEPGQSLAMALGQRLGDLVGTSELTGMPDLITCIPKFWLKRLVTGVNSSEMIMIGLGKRLRAATAHDLLVCKRKIKKQSLLSPDQRLRNVKSAWSVNSDFDIRDAHVMIVDDTMTTGATANEAARVLKRAGCSHVSLAVVGRAT